MLNVFKGVLPNGQSSPRDTATALNLAISGKLNALFEATLTAGAGSTVLTAANTPGVEKVGPESFIFPMPLTANAAAELAGGTMYVASQGKQTLTISHANNGQVDRSFRFLVIG